MENEQKESVAVSSRADSQDDQWSSSSDGNRRIAAKFRGTIGDQREMNMLGKKQVLRRNFKFFTMLGFASTVIASWEVVLPLFTFILIDGGTALLFWGFIACGIGLSLVYVSLAEAASMSPTAGGQYHWVSEFAPPKVQKLLSYLTGWLTAIGWQVYTAGTCFMVGTTIQGLIALNVENYVWQYWHGTLLTIAVIASSIVFNTVLAAQLPIFEGAAFVLHVLGFIAVVAPIWVMAPAVSPKEVILTFSNNGGWPTTGLSAMIGLTAPMSPLMGYDCSAHMAEEIRDASIVLPRALMWSVVINAILAFLMGVTLIFALGDIDSLLNTKTGQPFIQLFYNVTQSHSAVNTMTAIVIILLFGCATSEVATASRQLWAFARDQGVPGSAWLSRVTPGWDVPLRAVLVSLVITSLLACINLGSTTALNAINSLGGVAVMSSYGMTISCVIYRRVKGPPLPPRRWSLGRFGLAINIAALAFLLPVFFFYFWPLARPVKAGNMNWSSPLFCAALIVAMIHYFFKARHVYTGPVVHVKRDE